MRTFGRDMLRMLQLWASGAWWTLFVQGLCLTLFGLLVLVVPEVLVFLIAMLFIGPGILLIAIALRARRGRRSVRQVFEEFRFRDFDDDAG